ncbi:MAG TPA: DUF58 domain-containing protein [Spirochaetota bacterium]|nr:DUF58 domain-containing protein [Spirochaetota bacterium]HPS87395.1 DUF58 domain-containing protein [Spirochaetota bacterium]
MDSKEIALLKKIRLETGKKINTMFAGEYRSAFRGYGLSFDSVREYIPGDEVRRIDWNVSARMNHLFIREYIEERELSVVFMVDLSGSTDFGVSRKKKEVILEFLAMMLYLANMNNDRVSVILFSDKVEKFIRPGKGRKYVLKVLDEVIKCSPESRGTDISSAADFMQRVMKKRSVVFVISDFIDTKGDYLLRMRLMSKKHDVIPVHVYDPVEFEMNFFGLTEYLDLESGKTFLSESIPAKMKLPDTGEFDSIRLRTDQNIEVPILKFFSKRIKAG